MNVARMGLLAKDSKDIDLGNCKRKSGSREPPAGRDYGRKAYFLPAFFLVP
jgi:hypothetical protein